MDNFEWELKSTSSDALEHISSCRKEARFLSFLQ